MKSRFFAAILAVLPLISLVGCGGETENTVIEKPEVETSDSDYADKIKANAQQQ